MSAHQRRLSHRTDPRHLLVASPHVRGTPYDRQVVLLVERSSRGTVGLVLNDQFQNSLRRARGKLSNPLLQRASGESQWMALPVGIFQWGPGQLEAELNRGIWLTSSTEIHDLVGGHGNLWVDLVREIGRSVLRDALRIKRIPKDPSVN